MRKLILLLTLSTLASTACGDNIAPVTVLENGEACEADNLDEVCASNLCLEEFGDGVVISGGICTEECAWDYDLADFTKTCADGESCLKWGPTEELLCFEDCSSDSDCRTEDGWFCMCWDYHCFEGFRGTCFPEDLVY